jgi:UDP-N-acetylglucosamine acyltransferase
MADAHNIIHPTAILDGDIRMGSGNVIGAHTVLRGHITIGDGNFLDTGVILENRVEIGSHNHFYPYVVIGVIGEMGKKGDVLPEDEKVIIGDHVIIREFVCVHAPVFHKETRIHDHVYIMNKSYVAHDCVIGKGTVLSSGVLLGGRCTIDEHANLGLGAALHQRMHVGKFAMVGMQSVITRDILPYAIAAGNPSRILGFNRKGVESVGYDEKWLNEMDDYFRAPMRRTTPSDNPMIQEIYTFMENHPDCLLRTKN